jgi:predicted ArsR family transcriptional regulator
VSDSRLAILVELKKREPLSVAELAAALDLTTVTLRYHLDALVAEGLVAEPVRRPRAGPGRPEMAYSLTTLADERLPRNYGELCGCLFDALADRVSRPQLDLALRDAGRRLALQLALSPTPHFEARLRRALAVLEARGYLPALDQGAPDHRVIFAHCPYLEVSLETASVCRFDEALLETLLEARVEACARIADRQPACVFAVHPRPDSV